MRKSVFSIILLTLGFLTLGQSTEKLEGDSIPWEFRKQSFIYSSARLFNDPQVAKMALYNLISENPSNTSLYDSLAYLYLEYGQYASAALVAKQSLQLNPDNLFASEIAGNAFENLGVKDKAIPYYESVYLAKNDLTVLYKVAFLQMEAGRNQEARTSVDIIIRNEDSGSINMIFPKEGGDVQEIPLNAAATRVVAMIEESEGNDEEAKKLYLKTLEMSPGFQIVQRQLLELTKKDKE